MQVSQILTAFGAYCSCQKLLARRSSILRIPEQGEFRNQNFQEKFDVHISDPDKKIFNS